MLKCLVIQPVHLPEAKGEALSESKTINNKKQCGQHEAGKVEVESE